MTKKQVVAKVTATATPARAPWATGSDEAERLRALEAKVDVLDQQMMALTVRVTKVEQPV